MGKVPHLACSPNSWNSCSSLCPQPDGFHFSDSSWNYSRKTITYPPSRTPCYYKASLLPTLLIHSITKHNSIGPPWCMVLSSPGVRVYVTNTLLSHLSGVRPPIFSHITTGSDSK